MREPHLSVQQQQSALSLVRILLKLSMQLVSSRMRRMRGQLMAGKLLSMIVKLELVLLCQRLELERLHLCQMRILTLVERPVVVVEAEQLPLAFQRTILSIQMVVLLLSVCRMRSKKLQMKRWIEAEQVSQMKIQMWR